MRRPIEVTVRVNPSTYHCTSGGAVESGAGTSTTTTTTTPSKRTHATSPKLAHQRRSSGRGDPMHTVTIEGRTLSVRDLSSKVPAQQFLFDSCWSWSGIGGAPTTSTTTSSATPSWQQLDPDRRVASMASQQTEIFTSVVDPILSDFLHTGINGCVLAYGQTGSGKTHTMFGPAAAPGVIPRAVESAVEHVRNFTTGEGTSADRTTTRLTLEATVVEMYMESQRCLVSDSSDITVCERAVGGASGCYSRGAQKINLTDCNPVEASQRIVEAASRRQNRSTANNRRSSRSHVIVTLELTNTTFSDKKVATEQRLSVFRLVDLAGNERFDFNVYDEVQQQEARMINRSLSALNKVINEVSRRGAAAAGAAAADQDEDGTNGDDDAATRGSRASRKSTSTPKRLTRSSAFGPGSPSSITSPQPAPLAAYSFRESDLTRLLQDSIAGNSRTVMIATILDGVSPSTAEELLAAGPAMVAGSATATTLVQETLSTLRYADTTRSITTQCSPPPSKVLASPYPRAMSGHSKSKSKTKKAPGSHDRKPSVTTTHRGGAVPFLLDPDDDSGDSTPATTTTLAPRCRSASTDHSTAAATVAGFESTDDETMASSRTEASPASGSPMLRSHSSGPSFGSDAIAMPDDLLAAQLSLGEHRAHLQEGSTDSSSATTPCVSPRADVFAKPEPGESMIILNTDDYTEERCSEISKVVRAEALLKLNSLLEHYRNLYEETLKERDASRRDVDRLTTESKELRSRLMDRGKENDMLMAAVETSNASVGVQLQKQQEQMMVMLGTVMNEQRSYFDAFPPNSARGSCDISLTKHGRPHGGLLGVGGGASAKKLPLGGSASSPRQNSSSPRHRRQQQSDDQEQQQTATTAEVATMTDSATEHGPRHTVVEFVLDSDDGSMPSTPIRSAPRCHQNAFTSPDVRNSSTRLSCTDRQPHHQDEMQSPSSSQPLSASDEETRRAYREDLQRMKEEIAQLESEKRLALTPLERAIAAEQIDKVKARRKLAMEEHDLERRADETTKKKIAELKEQVKKGSARVVQLTQQLAASETLRTQATAAALTAATRELPEWLQLFVDGSASDEAASPRHCHRVARAPATVTSAHKCMKEAVFDDKQLGELRLHLEGLMAQLKVIVLKVTKSNFSHLKTMIDDASKDTQQVFNKAMLQIRKVVLQLSEHNGTGGQRGGSVHRQDLLRWSVHEGDAKYLQPGQRRDIVNACQLLLFWFDVWNESRKDEPVSYIELVSNGKVLIALAVAALDEAPPLPIFNEREASPQPQQLSSRLGGSSARRSLSYSLSRRGSVDRGLSFFAGGEDDLDCSPEYHRSSMMPCPLTDRENDAEAAIENFSTAAPSSALALAGSLIPSTARPSNRARLGRLSTSTTTPRAAASPNPSIGSPTPRDQQGQQEPPASRQLASSKTPRTTRRPQPFR